MYSKSQETSAGALTPFDEKRVRGVIEKLGRHDLNIGLSALALSQLSNAGAAPDDLSPELQQALAKRIVELMRQVGTVTQPLYAGNGEFHLRPASPGWSEAVRAMLAFDREQQMKLTGSFQGKKIDTETHPDFSNVKFFALGGATNYAARVMAALRADTPESSSAALTLSQLNHVHYPDGAQNYRLPNVRNKGLVIFIDPSQHADLTLGQLNSFCSAAHQNNCEQGNITVISPYFPMRSDRPTRGHREAAMYKAYIDLLKNAGVTRLVTFDPHFKQFGLLSDKTFKIEEVFPSAAVLPYMNRHLRLDQDVAGITWDYTKGLFAQESVGFISPDSSAYTRNELLSRLAGIPQAEVAVVKKRKDANVDSKLLAERDADLPRIALGSDDIGSSLSTVVLAAALAKHGTLSKQERQAILADPTKMLQQKQVSGSKLFIAMLTHMQAVGPFAERALCSPYVDAWVITDTCALNDIPMGKFGPKGPFGNRIHVVSTAQIAADALTMLFTKPNGKEPSLSKLATALIPEANVLSLYGSSEPNISERFAA